MNGLNNGRSVEVILGLREDVCLKVNNNGKQDCEHFAPCLLVVPWYEHGDQVHEVRFSCHEKVALGHLLPSFEWEPYSYVHVLTYVILAYVLYTYADVSWSFCYYCISLLLHCEIVSNYYRSWQLCIAFVHFITV